MPTMGHRKAGHRTNDKSKYLESVSDVNTSNSRWLLTRPTTIKRSSRPAFLIMVDLTYNLARTKRVATPTKVDCIARKAEDWLALGRIIAGAETLLDQAILLQQGKMTDDGSFMEFGLAPTILSQKKENKKPTKKTIELSYRISRASPLCRISR